MRKRLAVLVVGTALAGVMALAGCGGSGAAQQEAADSSAPAETSAAQTASALAPGEYTAEFNTDSSMFHVNESLDGKGTLTVQPDGQMTIHVTLESKRIVNLYPGTAAQAEADEANWLQPTTDQVTYDDGYQKEAYGFDVVVPAIGEPFDLALLGEKGNWYDHKVTVDNPVPAEK